MKLRPSMTLAFMVAAGAAWAQPAAPVPGVTIAFDDIQLVPTDLRAPDGFATAVLWGDPTSGPSAMLLRLPRGELPMHVHTSSYHLVVLRGTMKHWGAEDADAAAKPLPPGSYWFQPGGAAHRDACLSEQCLVYLNWAGRRDGYRPPPKS